MRRILKDDRKHELNNKLRSDGSVEDHLILSRERERGKE